MQEILDVYPSAQRALLRSYHNGGSNSCGYEPEGIIEAVEHQHKITDMDELLEHAEQSDLRIHVSPRDVAAALRSDNPLPLLVDVRALAEWELARIQGATLNTEDLEQEMMRWPKATPIVFFSHLGQRSLDAASYFAGHGFKDVRSMTGGIDAWSLEVDSSVPRYEVAPNPGHSKATLRLLRSVASKAAGYQTQENVR